MNIRAQRCDTRALQIVRAQVLSDLQIYKNGRAAPATRSLGVLDWICRGWIAAAYAAMLIFLCTIVILVLGEAVLATYFAAKWLIHLIF